MSSSDSRELHLQLTRLPTAAAFSELTNGIRANESMTTHQLRMREATVKIMEMKFADLDGFLDSVQAFSSFNKMCAMRNKDTNAEDNLKTSVWREACLKVCIKMNEDPRPLTLEPLDAILQEVYAALDNGPGNKKKPPLSTTSLAPKLQEQADAHKRDISDLKYTVSFKTRGHHGGRGGHHGGPRVHANEISIDGGSRGGF